MIDKDFEQNTDSELSSPYCSICGACGEDPCCAATMCQMHPHGDYCGGYLAELRIGYILDKYPSISYDEAWDMFHKDRYTKRVGSPLKSNKL